MGEASESSGHEEENQEGLEGRLNDNDEDSHSSEKTEYAARDSGRNYDGDNMRHSKEQERNQNPKSSQNKKSGTIDSKVTVARAYSLKVERSNHGSVALIYYEDSSTGDVKFIFEEKPHDYIPESERGKLGLVGGALDIINGNLEDSHEALMRELDEEIEDPLARKILKRKLERENDYDLRIDYLEGEAYHTYIYKIKISSPLEWAIISNSRSADNSGPLRTVTRDDFASKRVTRDSFIFTQGDFMIRYLAGKYGVKAEKPSHRHAHKLNPDFALHPAKTQPLYRPNIYHF